MKIEIINCRTNPTVSGEYVGRPSPLGNPFSHIQGCGNVHVATREKAIAQYEKWLKMNLAVPNSPQAKRFRHLVDYLKKKKKINLICWCAPAPCHAEVIKRLLLQSVREG